MGEVTTNWRDIHDKIVAKGWWHERECGDTRDGFLSWELLEGVLSQILLSGASKSVLLMTVWDRDQEFYMHAYGTRKGTVKFMLRNSELGPLGGVVLERKARYFDSYDAALTAYVTKALELLQVLDDEDQRMAAAKAADVPSVLTEGWL